MGPCLCGDLCCPHCGNPQAAKIEEAEVWLTEICAKAQLSPEEYRIVASVGLAAVHQCRRQVKWSEEGEY